MSTAPATQPTSVYQLTAPLVGNGQKPYFSAAIIFAADFLALSIVLGTFLNSSTSYRYFNAANGPILALSVPLLLLLYWRFQLYPGVSINPVVEIRSICLANFTAFCLISVILIVERAGILALLGCLSSLVLATFLIPTIRTLIRKLGSRWHWWGHSVVLFGAGVKARSILRKLISQPHLGLRPIAIVADHINESEIEGVPLVKSQHIHCFASQKVRHAIVAAPELSPSAFTDLIEGVAEIFPSLFLIPNTDFIWRCGTQTRDLVGTLGIHVQNNLLNRESRFAKRALDLVCGVTLMILLLPVYAVISLLVVTGSGFPIFYRQQRLGRGGQRFTMFKFRTMSKNSAEILHRSLRNNSQLRREWTENHKLKHDPRVTRIGSFLRKTSLDELPQLWNVIKGEMSLVGPRPIVEAEVIKYRESYALYSQMTPGITGLWQVSGRNSTTYAERVACDACYVRNWSVWLDVYILAKTVHAVSTGDGAC